MNHQQDKKYHNAFSLVELSIVILIIGILTASIIKGSRIYKEIRLASARSLTKSSVVNSMKNLVSWWEPTLDESFLKTEIQSDDLKISIWYDNNPQTTDKKNLIQNNNNQKPIFSLYSINNLPSLKFNGTDYLETSFSPNLNSKEYSIFTVIKPESINGHGTILASRDYPPHSGITIYLTPNSQYYIMQGNGVNAWSENSNSDKEAEMKKIEILSYIRTSSKLTSYSKGNLIGDNEFQFGVNTKRNLRIGAGATESSPKYFFIGYIGEIIIFDKALSDKERTSVEKYLIQKWL